ncbi:MAG: RNA polymerase sigma factor [Gammaproteobacteria bacterium]|nr:RNA polymerase sigma factor [Gammaproteobacteria bacterium]
MDAFAELIGESQSRVRTFLVRLCRDYDLADDLAQDTFVTAYQKLASYRGSGSFEGWLCKIAYNRFLQYKRDDKRKREILAQYGEMLEVESGRYDSASDIQLELEKAFSALNHGEVAAITLCHSFGFSHQEVATILNTPLGTVKSQIRRGKDKLKEVLSATIDHEHDHEHECSEEKADRKVAL